MSETPPRKNPLREIVQPFVDVVHAPRALWGVNLPYLIEGFVYFGVVGYLLMYFNQYIHLGDIHAGWMVGVQTTGITLAMLLIGPLVDRWGVRLSLIAALAAMFVGRCVLSVVAYTGLRSGALDSSANLVALSGILIVVTGYGLYQPAAYAAVRQFTTEKTAAMGYGMLYALMNLGGWLPTFMTPIRERYGIKGTFWVFSACTLAACATTILILTKRTVAEARAAAEAGGGGEVVVAKPADPALSPASSGDRMGAVPESWIDRFAKRVWEWIRQHPFANAKFSFFIFSLIPVQTLFAHNWLTLPPYVERGYRESWPWISANFEKATNFNPLLIFILVPIVTALTQKASVYRMMIIGTLVMAAPAFLLALGPTPWTLLGYLVLSTIGEAMWQPRFLQYAAEIAPPGRTGAYMGVAQFPWFVTKAIVPLYSGWFLERYCPATGAVHTERMWFVYACIAMASTVLLILAKNWLGRGFKERAA